MAKIMVIYELCEHCKGTGKITAFTDIQIDCPKCEATGKVKWGEIVEEEV